MTTSILLHICGVVPTCIYYIIRLKMSSTIFLFFAKNLTAGREMLPAVIRITSDC